MDPIVLYLQRNFVEGVTRYLTQDVRILFFGDRYYLELWQLGVLMGFATFVFAALIMSREPKMRIGGRVINFFSSVLAAPVIEEIIFRLVLISVFIVMFNSTLVAVGVSSFLFALAHVFYGRMKFVDTFVVGLLYGWAFVNLGLGITIIAHMTHNFFAVMTSG